MLDLGAPTDLPTAPPKQQVQTANSYQLVTYCRLGAIQSALLIRRSKFQCQHYSETPLVPTNIGESRR